MKAILKALFGDLANCITAALAVLAAAGLVLTGHPQLASWLLPVLLLVGAVLLALRYGRG